MDSSEKEERSWREREQAGKMQMEKKLGEEGGGGGQEIKEEGGN